MTLIKIPHTVRTLLLTIGLAISVFPGLARGEEADGTLDLFNAFQGDGYTFTETTRTSDDTQVKPDKASHTVQLALRYDDRTYRAMLAGRHINWNSPLDANAGYGGLFGIFTWGQPCSIARASPWCCSFPVATCSMVTSTTVIFPPTLRAGSKAE